MHWKTSCRRQVWQHGSATLQISYRQWGRQMPHTRIGSQEVLQKGCKAQSPETPHPWKLETPEASDAKRQGNRHPVHVCDKRDSHISGDIFTHRTNNKQARWWKISCRELSERYWSFRSYFWYDSIRHASPHSLRPHVDSPRHVPNMRLKHSADMAYSKGFTCLSAEYWNVTHGEVMVMTRSHNPHKQFSKNATTTRNSTKTTAKTTIATTMEPEESATFASG